MKAAKQINMSEGPIASGMIEYSIPLILGDVLQLFYNTADSIIVGNFVGKEALAAVGSSSTVINVFLGLFIGISLGCSVLISRHYGAGNREGLHTSVRTAVWLTLIAGTVITIAGYCLTPYMLKLLDTPADVMADASSYLSIYFLGAIAQVMYNILAAILRAVGDSRRPMLCLGLSTLLNVGLDLYFIRSLGWGVAGAAIATIIAQFICIIILFFLLLNTEDFRGIALFKPILDKNSLNVIFKVGIPYGIQRAVVAFSNTVVLSYIYHFGSSAMAAWSVFSKVDQIVMMTNQSLCNAITTCVSQNLGAGKPDRVHKGLMTGLWLLVGIWIVCGIVMIGFRFEITSLFNKDPEVLEYAGIAFIYMMVPYILCGLSNGIFGALRGQGHSTAPMVITITSLVVIRQVYLHMFWDSFKSFPFVVSCYSVVWIFMLLGTIGYCIWMKKKDPAFVI